MVTAILKKIIGTKNERELKRIQPMAYVVNELEREMKGLSDVELQGKTSEFRQRLANGETSQDLLPEAFAVVREASCRVLGMRHYDVQIIGGIVLHEGKIAEMKTGEGKTLVATLSVYLNALESRGVHVVTVNDYLARRDAEWMGRIYRFLGLSVGSIIHDMSDFDRQVSYRCDVTYGTNNEFGFDYLRDNMKFSLEDYVQRDLHYAIVDEVDSILVDEARTPLIISGPAEESTDRYYKVNAIVPFLKRDEDYIVDEKSHTATLTETGVDKVERRLDIGNLYDSQNIEFLHHVTQALKAHTLYRRDVNYLIEEGKVIIIDEFTGRKMPGRRWSDGLHQAVEAKEGLRIEEENQTLATITFQNYFRMYDKLAGMTGTAETEAEEFAKIYNLDVLVMPTNMPCIRADQDDAIYKTEKGKFWAVVEDIKDCSNRGQPVLVGTVSVEKSEHLASLLRRAGVRHNVLNAKFHQKEAEIIAQAGQKSAVTISTNMAGRGTDIVLGGNPEFLAKNKTEAEGTESYQEALEFFTKRCLKDRNAVLSAGGMKIIGTERHEARRIDNQLRGRSGRQGDPGASRFYLSLDDDLLRIFGGERLKKIMERLNMPADQPIEHKWVTRSIENAQKKVEGHNFDIRKNLLEYDDVMNQQRKAVYELRRQILEGKSTRDLVLDAFWETAAQLLDEFCPEDIHSDEWDMEGLRDALARQLGVKVETRGWPDKRDELEEGLYEEVRTQYKRKEERIVERICIMRAEETGREPSRDDARESWRNFERHEFLREIDRQWKNHLLVMDHFKEGVYLEAYGQKDPKLIYKKEGFNIFQEMMGRIQRNVVTTLFQVEVQDERQMQRTRRPRRRPQMTYGRGNAPGKGSKRSAQRTGPKVGRNAPCPCGSGKKYKKCCLSKQ